MLVSRELFCMSSCREPSLTTSGGRDGDGVAAAAAAAAGDPERVLLSTARRRAARPLTYRPRRPPPPGCPGCTLRLPIRFVRSAMSSLLISSLDGLSTCHGNLSLPSRIFW